MILWLFIYGKKSEALSVTYVRALPMSAKSNIVILAKTDTLNSC